MRDPTCRAVLATLGLPRARPNLCRPAVSPRDGGSMWRAPLRSVCVLDMQFVLDALTPGSRKTSMRRCLTLVAVVSLLPTAALAHTGVGDAHGFVHGFAHPLGGLDHVLAMVTVGIFAWQLGGRALWLVPATFVLMMAAAGALGLYGIAVPFVEFG